MTLDEYTKASKELLSLCESICNAKRPAYTLGSEDVLANFKTVATRLGISPLQVWGTYTLKHMDSITSLAKNPDIPQAEAIESRFADAVNYLLLGYCLVKEGK